MKKLFLMASCLFAFVAFTSCGGSESAALGYLDMLSNDQTAELAENAYYSEDAMKDLDKSKNFVVEVAKADAKAMKEKKGIKDVEVLKENKVVTYEVEISYEDGSKEKAEVAVAEHEGDWKYVGFRTIK